MPARLTVHRCDVILRHIGNMGDMAIPIGDLTLEHVLNHAQPPAHVSHPTGCWRAIPPADDREFRREIDAPCLEALVQLARANLQAAKAQPRQVYEAEDWTALPPAFLPLGGSDPQDGFHVIMKASSERPMTAAEMAAAPRGAMSGTVISVGFPVALVLATVKNRAQLAARIAHLMTEDTKGA